MRACTTEPSLDDAVRNLITGQASCGRAVVPLAPRETRPRETMVFTHNTANADTHSFVSHCGALLPGRVTLGLVCGSLRHALHHQAHGRDCCMRYLEQRRQ